MRVRRLLLMGLLISLLVPAVHAQVKTTGGVLKGSTVAGGRVRVFKGVPFAAPPVGALRWTPPQPAAPWTGVRAATEFGAHCLQGPIFGDMIFREPSEPRHDGHHLVQKNVVVISANHRLGVFGFLAHPDLAKESGNTVGNFGLQDMIAALQWVKANAAAFGGDPDNVTIFGESAGSFAVNALMASPRARGLFHKAIGESGAFFGPALAPGSRCSSGTRRGSGSRRTPRPGRRPCMATASTARFRWRRHRRAPRGRDRVRVRHARQRAPRDVDRRRPDAV